MKPLGQITAKLIKKHIPPEKFYKMVLGGELGKGTYDGWHQWKSLCPFHDDRHIGTFYINIKTGAYICFSCDAKGGDIIDFYMMKERLIFTDALKQLGRFVICAQ